MSIFSKKIFCALISVFLVSASLTFAEEAMTEQEKHQKELNDENWEETKKTFKSVGNFFSNQKDKLDKKIQSNKKTACEGKWKFESDGCVTILLCNSDGTMNVRMDKGEDIKLWKGSFESTKNEISFHITAYNERISGKDKFDSLHEDDWHIDYKVTDTVELTLTSEKMPVDLNGYSFKNSTKFNRVK